MSDVIYIEKLIFSGKHGAYSEERNVEQELEINIKIETDFSKSKNSDKLDDTIDYDVVKNKVQEIIEKTTSYLIENLSEKIAQSILEDKRVERVEVNIRKIAVWGNGVPSVTIVRENR